MHFADFENCKAFMMDLRWPDGVVKCPHCGSTRVIWLAKARVWKCYEQAAPSRFSLKTGTIFEDSPLGLDKWLTAVWLIVNCKNGISSYEIHRDSGRHSEDRMVHASPHPLRDAQRRRSTSCYPAKSKRTKLSSAARRATCTWEARSDASPGPAARTRRPSWEFWSAAGQGSRLSVVPNRKKHALQAEVRKHVEAGSALYTDALLSLRGTAGEYAHRSSTMP